MLRHGSFGESLSAFLLAVLNRPQLALRTSETNCSVGPTDFTVLS